MRVELPVLLTREPGVGLTADVLAKGNGKLGETVYSFSLPAITTCGRGSTALCRRLCYADRARSRFSTDVVQERYWTNLALTQRPDFHDVVVAFLARTTRPLFRWHVSGDLYDEAYAWKVLQVSRNSPDATMWMYTRTWRDPAIATVLAELALLPNFNLWYSCDAETGAPKDVPPRVRLAYMQTAREEVPDYQVDLVFRENALRGEVVKRVGDSLVCPAENGVSHGVTCEKCRICLSDPAADPTRRTRGRFNPVGDD